MLCPLTDQLTDLLIDWPTDWFIESSINFWLIYWIIYELFSLFDFWIGVPNRIQLNHSTRLEHLGALSFKAAIFISRRGNDAFACLRNVQNDLRPPGTEAQTTKTLISSGPMQELILFATRALCPLYDPLPSFPDSSHFVGALVALFPAWQLLQILSLQKPNFWSGQRCGEIRLRSGFGLWLMELNDSLVRWWFSDFLKMFQANVTVASTLFLGEAASIVNYAVLWS